VELQHSINLTVIWDVSKVTDMECMFAGAEAFNQPISRRDVSTVNDAEGTFDACSILPANKPPAFPALIDRDWYDSFPSGDY
jgi:hypothetical protein